VLKPDASSALVDFFVFHEVGVLFYVIQFG